MGFDKSVGQTENGLIITRLPRILPRILWLEVCPYKSSRSLFIGGVYRPPSFTVADDKRLGKNIENVRLFNKETILLGDINIDFLCTMKLQKLPFIKTLQNLNMSQLVMEIT